MILVDTSVWVNHLRRGQSGLVELLNEGQVLAHPAVIGELALGSLKDRDEILGALADLPPSRVATADELLRFIDQQKLFGSGIGYVDAHLLAAAKLTPGSQVWTADRRLGLAAEKLGLAYIA